MKIGRHKSRDRQPQLFTNERLLTSVGAARSWVGDYFEELTSALTGARRIKTDGTADICPDMQLDTLHEPTYFECKGVGASGQGIIYQGRFHKDAAFIHQHQARIFYWFWRHTFRVANAATIPELYAGLAASTFVTAVVSHAALSSVLNARELRQVNSGYGLKGQRNGYGNEAKGYGIGWTFPVALIIDQCHARRQFQTAYAYGRRATFDVYAEADELLTMIRSRR